jgi:hypothetical protein
VIRGVRWCACAISVLLALPLAARAATLFHEDFDGYTSFPSQDPIGDPINPGLAKISEGADSHWYGIRFETPSSGSSLDGDLAVQKVGGATNLTPVGRVEDEAGMAFRIDTVDYQSATLEFDWRTFLVSGADRLRVGYFVGDIPGFASSDYFDARGTPYAWANWTPLLEGKGDVIQHASYSLPVGASSLWVVFWLDNGEGDYGKFDNVEVTAVPTPVPEPGVALLAALAAAAAVTLRRVR